MSVNKWKCIQFQNINQHNYLNDKEIGYNMLENQSQVLEQPSILKRVDLYYINTNPNLEHN